MAGSREIVEMEQLSAQDSLELKKEGIIPKPASPASSGVPVPLNNDNTHRAPFTSPAEIREEYFDFNIKPKI